MGHSRALGPGLLVLRLVFGREHGRKTTREHYAEHEQSGHRSPHREVVHLRHAVQWYEAKRNDRSDEYGILFVLAVKHHRKGQDLDRDEQKICRNEQSRLLVESPREAPERDRSRVGYH